MTQDKAHPTPPAVPSEPENRYCNKCGYIGPHIEHNRPRDGKDCAYFSTFARPALPSLAAPVASNTTAEPAPIQPAGGA